MKNMRWPIAVATVLLIFTRLPGAIAQAAPAAEPSRNPQLVIIDTDIGDDIDDAFALALALESPELRILGVSTAFGDTALRARLVDRYLDAVGRANIPVAEGVRTPDTHFTQAAYARLEPARHHADAVSFLLGQIRAHPGQITLIAIGPLFNIQAAIARDPATFRKLKRVVMMGGSIYRGYNKGNTSAHTPPEPEWNVLCDPAGARALLASGVPIFMMPLDSTQIPLQQAGQAQIFSRGSRLSDQLTLLYHEWSGAGAWRTPTLFDPVTVAYALHPDLCPVKPMRIQVESNGLTRPVAGAPNAEVCLQSDEAGILNLLLTRIALQPGNQAGAAQ
ncbi:MAG TPA: nucleoside hydrolase [Terracidiphilus sp.]